MVQRRAARVALNRYHNISNVSDMLQQLGWMSLQERRMVLRLCVVNNIQKGVVSLGRQEPLLTTTRSSIPDTLIVVVKRPPFLVLHTIKCLISRGRFAIGMNYQILLCRLQVQKPSRAAGCRSTFVINVDQMFYNY